MSRLQWWRLLPLRLQRRCLSQNRIATDSDSFSIAFAVSLDTEKSRLAAKSKADRSVGGHGLNGITTRIRMRWQILQIDSSITFFGLSEQSLPCSSLSATKYSPWIAAN